MHPTPVTRRLQPLVKTGGPRPTDTHWSQLLTELTDANFVTIAIFCAFGLLLTANVIMRFPEFGAVLQEFSYPPL